MKTRILLAAACLAATPALAERQSWQTSHQSTRFEDIIQMQAFADADQGPDRLGLYCDTSNGFRVLIFPKRFVLSEGATKISIRIDDKTPIIMDANAFGDDDTDVVVPLNTDKVERAISAASHVTIHYGPPGVPAADVSFTFEGLAAAQKDVLKVCPLGR
jgi:hypothetical protein